MPIRIVLVDDHVLVRQGLKALIESDGSQVMGEASDGQEALRQVESLRPDIVVMDISMPSFNGSIRVVVLPTLKSGLAPEFITSSYAEDSSGNRGDKTGPGMIIKPDSMSC